MTGDGLADMVLLRPSGVEVYGNMNGEQFLLFADLSPTDLGALWSPDVRLQFLDMNGSGVDDIVLSDRELGYIDVTGGQRAGLLTSISNGVGAQTSVEYATLAQLDHAANPPWKTHSAQSVHVVTRVATWNGLAAPRSSTRVAQYTYRDPFYDPRSGQFQGFEHVSTFTPPDEVSPGAKIEEGFLVGRCPHEQGIVCDYTGDDSPWEALRGHRVTDTVTDSIGFVTYRMSHSMLGVRRAAEGLDGRWVRQVFTRVQDTYRFDASDPGAAPTTVSLADVQLDGMEDAALATTSTLALPSTRGMVHTRRQEERDTAGRVTKNVDFGKVEPSIDPVIVTTHDWYVPDGALFFVSRIRTDHVSDGDAAGNASGVPRSATYAHDAAGNLTDVIATITGTRTLSRAGAVAVPGTASVEGSTVTRMHIDVDPVYGTAERRTQPNGRVEVLGYDVAFHQLLVSRSVQTGSALPTLTSRIEYDRGFEAPTRTTSATGTTSTTTYDGLGRPTDVTKPAAHGSGTVASMHYAYGDVSNNLRRVHVLTTDADGALTRSGWMIIDGLGATVATIAPADPSAGDAGTWLVSDQTAFSSGGRVARIYRPMFWNGNPETDVPSLDAVSASLRYDSLDRVVSVRGLDGTEAVRNVYHAVSTDVWDAEDLAPGPHAGTPTTTTMDGHGRRVQVVERSVAPAGSNATTTLTYLATGEIRQLTRVYDDAPGPLASTTSTYVRSMEYDSFGRVVRNVEPNTSRAGGAWEYAYDDAGDLVASADARGCGKNLYYDALGRTVAEDYVPCTPDQPPYTAPDLATGDGTEAFYRYDAPEPDQSMPTADAAAWPGRLVSIRDRAMHARFGYDMRGRQVAASRRVAKPGAPDAALSARYASHWFDRKALYDEADRIKTQTTGADAAELLVGGESSVTTELTARGLGRRVTSSYGVLVHDLTYDEDGNVTGSTLGDAAATKTTLEYANGNARRLRRVAITRTPPAAWTTPPSGYSPPTEVTDPVLMDLTLVFDGVGNPRSMSDTSRAGQWPAGAKPVSRSMDYDDRYRLVHTTYDSGSDSFSDPAGSGSIPSVPPSTSARVKSQSFSYDGTGNRSSATDDADDFYDRSLDIENYGIGASGPNQLRGASSTAGDATMSTEYDGSGNLTHLTVHRVGACAAAAVCDLEYLYDWDEVGQLARARRLDAGLATADLSYSYDALGGRVTSARSLAPALRVQASGAGFAGLGEVGSSSYDVAIYSTLTLRDASWDNTSTDYDHTAKTEEVHLASGGMMLGQVFYGDGLPSLKSGPHARVLFTLGDSLGSPGLVIDQETGEVVERSTYQAYGARESAYRPARWAGVHGHRGFSGGDEDAEVGLVAIGARYYAPSLGQWISPDPVTVHMMGADVNPYAYVSGRVTALTDPSGLGPDTPFCGSNDGGVSETCSNVGEPVQKPGGSHAAGLERDETDFFREGAERDYREQLGGMFPGSGGGPSQGWDPGNEPRGLYIGKGGHAVVNIAYAAAHPGQNLFINRWIYTIVRKLVGPAPSFLLPGMRDRPDIFNADTGDLYEVKSEEELERGVSEATEYVAKLTKLGVAARLGTPGAPGTSGRVAALGGYFTWRSPAAGVIAYRFDMQPVTLPVTSKSGQTQEQRNAANATATAAVGGMGFATILMMLKTFSPLE